MITPNHPIRINGSWIKPRNLSQEIVRIALRTTVYNFVLDKKHIMKINGIECVTLGHEIKGNNIEHAYFGTKKIIIDL